MRAYEFSDSTRHPFPAMRAFEFSDSTGCRATGARTTISDG